MPGSARCGRNPVPYLIQAPDGLREVDAAPLGEVGDALEQGQPVGIDGPASRGREITKGLNGA